MTATKRALDFTNVSERSFNTKRMPSGDYKARITKVEDYRSNAGNDQWLFSFQLVEFPSAVYPYYCGLDEKSLWKVRNVFAACGFNIPKKLVNVDPNKAVGREVGVTLEDDEYDGKPKSVISAVIPVKDMGAPPAAEDADDDDEEVEEEEPTPAPAKKAAAAKKAAPAPPPEVEEDELEEIDIEEI